MSLLKRSAILVTAVVSFAFYLTLTAGSGSIGLWSIEEIVAGIVIAAIAGIASTKLLPKAFTATMTPMRILKFAAYLVYPFSWELFKANMDVAQRVITNEINPAIVKIPSKQDSDTGTFLIATSITLTPGTLTLDTGDNSSLYIHWINAGTTNPKTEDICNKMAAGVKKVLE